MNSDPHKPYGRGAFERSAKTNLDEIFISALLTGIQEAYDIFIKQDYGYTHEFREFISLISSSSIILDNLFVNLIDSHGSTTYYYTIKSLFMSAVYDNYDGFSIKRQFFINGRTALADLVKAALKRQITPTVIESEFHDEVDSMVAMATQKGEAISREELVEIKREQVIEFVFRIYIDSIFYPTEKYHYESSLSKFLTSNVNIPFIDLPLKVMSHRTHEFFKTFELRLYRSDFSDRTTSLLLNSLKYSISHLTPSYISAQGLLENMVYVSELYRSNEFIGENFEIFTRLRALYKIYFNEYVAETGVNQFTIKFFLETPKGITKSYSNLKESKLVGAQGSEIGEGIYLNFEINSVSELDIMISSMLYYMLEFDCIAVVQEGTPTDTIFKYALIASPSRILKADYFRTDTSRLEIKTRTMSDKFMADFEVLSALLANNLADLRYIPLYLFKDNIFRAMCESTGDIISLGSSNTELPEQVLLIDDDDIAQMDQGEEFDDEEDIAFDGAYPTRITFVKDSEFKKIALCDKMGYDPNAREPLALVEMHSDQVVQQYGIKHGIVLMQWGNPDFGAYHILIKHAIANTHFKDAYGPQWRYDNFYGVYIIASVLRVVRDREPYRVWDETDDQGRDTIVLLYNMGSGKPPLRLALAKPNNENLWEAQIISAYPDFNTPPPT
ncbi:MAG: hypothetical protein ACTSR8_08980 [Promethearchaeota archaeon]